ncbi:serine protease [Gigaspora margarita]|uniref:Serine protease n=1 Tax=Gigaspora margarita TaxID=4874 RepID=A0A8H4ET56_GIGMA|nr:serine protease [Gigaspora margarita]
MFNSFNSSNLMPRQTIDNRLLGGDGIRTLNTLGTAGFWVRAAGREFLATAGHNARSENVEFYDMPSEGEYNTLIGPMIIRDISGLDRGYIMKTNRQVLASPMIRNWGNDEFPELEIMAVTDPDTEGMPICKAGFTTGATCGEITGVVDTLTRERDGRVVNNVVFSDMECQGGDSGSPVYAYLDELMPTVLLVGLVFGETGGLCIFHPVNAILLPGMQVITNYS